MRLADIRARHRVGQHLLAFADGGADWCRRCGDFDRYLRDCGGTPTECRPVPRVQRFWPERKRKE